MAANAPASDEAHHLGTGEPAVGQHVAEPHPHGDGAPYHLDGQRDLAPVVFLQPFHDGAAFPSFLGVSLAELVFPHAVVAFPPLLTDKGEVEQHLALPVGDAEEETLEAEYHLVGDVGEHLADGLRVDPPLLGKSVSSIIRQVIP